MALNNNKIKFYKVVPKIILAFDQATHKTGYSIWNKDTKELIGYGLINISKGDTIDRINQLNTIIDEFYNSIKDISECEIWLEDIQYQPNKEESGAILFGQKISKSEDNGVVNIKTFKTLAWLQGILMSWCYKNSIKFETMFASSWKSFCGVKGINSAIQKQNSINFVSNQFNIDVSSDVADAICLGWTAVNKNK